MSRFVVIEGLIGVGKTTLCRLLCKELKASLILEPAEDNPFLAQFYDDPDRFAFPTQMFYLANRFAQYEGLKQPDLFTDLVVADYLWEKDRLFAEHTLSDVELDLYDRFTELLGLRSRRPDLVLFLDAPTDVIVGRIQKRAIDAEQVIESEYLDTLRDRYYRLWDRYEHAPVFVLDTTEIDYVDDPAGQELVVDMVRSWLSGRAHPLAPPQHRAGSGPGQLRLFTA